MTAGTTKVTTPAERTIRIERVFDAPRETLWRALTDPQLVAMWWGRGNRLDVQTMEVRPGGHWRYVEHAPDGDSGFEGRYAEVVEPERTSQTFDWDGMPGHPSYETATLEDLGDGRTRFVSEVLFYTQEERDGMMAAGMEQGMDQSYAALDRVLQSMK